jgi:hypothetical protein
LSMTINEPKNCHCTRCGKYAFCSPHNKSTAWLCHKCADEWSEIYRTKVEPYKDNAKKFWKLWDAEFKILLNGSLGEREKVKFD